MANKKADFKETLLSKIDDYMDRAFNTEDLAKRQQYREAIQAMQRLLVMVSELE